MIDESSGHSEKEACSRIMERPYCEKAKSNCERKGNIKNLEVCFYASGGKNKHQCFQKAIPVSLNFQSHSSSCLKICLSSGDSLEGKKKIIVRLH